MTSVEFTEKDFNIIQKMAERYAKECSFLTEEDLYQEACLKWLEAKSVMRDDVENESSAYRQYRFVCIDRHLREYVDKNEVKVVETVHGLDMDDFISDDTNFIEDDTAFKVDVENAIAVMHEVLAEKYVRYLSYYYGVGYDRPHTFVETGKEFGVTATYANAVVVGGLRRLRHPKRCRAMGIGWGAF